MYLMHQLLILLLISIAVFTIDVKQNYFPVPVVLVLVGIGLSFIPLFSDFSISSDILYEVFIPGLLFISSYQLSAKAFKNNASLMITLSTLGMIGTVFVLGSGIYYLTSLFQPFTWSLSLLLASILVPTDPVSVVSILKNSTGSKQIADVVEGESMLNDGTSIVMFTIFLSMAESGDPFSLINFLGSFVYVSLGGVGIGLLFGWILSKTIHITSHREYQVMISVLIAYGSFSVAEHFGFSGVLAVVVSGISLSFALTVKDVKEDEFRHALGGFWDVINPILTSVLFLIIGITSGSYIHFNFWHIAFIIFIISIVARFLVLVTTFYLIPKWQKKFNQGFSVFYLLSWAGIKGSMSVVLLLWTTESSVGEYKLFTSLAYATILISFIIQSLGIYPLTKALKRK